MTIVDHDARCNALFREKQTLTPGSPEYMRNLRELQAATEDRLVFLGLRQITLGGR